MANVKELPIELRTIEEIWVNPPQIESKVPRIILKLEPSEVEIWTISPDLIKDNKLELTSATQSSSPANSTLIDRSFSLGESLIREPGWGVAFALAAILAWREYRNWRLVKKLDKIDVIKIASAIGEVWKKAMVLDRSSTKDSSILAKDLRADMKRLKTGVNEVKQISLETGEEISGQLHTLEEIVGRIEQKVDEVRDDMDDFHDERRYRN